MVAKEWVVSSGFQINNDIVIFTICLNPMFPPKPGVIVQQILYTANVPTAAHMVTDTAPLMETANINKKRITREKLSASSVYEIPAPSRRYRGFSSKVVVCKAKKAYFRARDRPHELPYCLLTPYCFLIS